MNKQETAQQLRKVANFLKGLQQAADDIEAIGSMEGATSEARKARDVAQAERDQALAEFADAKAKATKAAKDAQAKVDAMLADAQGKAEKLVADADAQARRTANDMIAAAERRADEVTTKAGSSVQAAEKALADMAEKKAALAAEVGDLEAKAKAAQAEHDKLVKALDKIKAQFRIAED